MPRPRKWKKVCCLPEVSTYGPLGNYTANDAMIIMSIEEYETLRLLDYEGMTQEAAAEKMQVARATVQKLYFEARKKMTTMLVESKPLKIEGGDYQLYNEKEQEYGCGRCRRKRAGKRFPSESI